MENVFTSVGILSIENVGIFPTGWKIVFFFNGGDQSLEKVLAILNFYAFFPFYGIKKVLEVLMVTNNSLFKFQSCQQLSTTRRLNEQLTVAYCLLKYKFIYFFFFFYGR